MTETEALKRRDDELTMGDEGEGQGAVDLTPTPEDARANDLGASSLGIGRRDELPRDSSGNVIGTWHVHCCWSDVLDDRSVAPDAIEGAAVERALALGCTVLPGPRPAEGRIVLPIVE